MAKNTKGKWELHLIGDCAFDETTSSLQKMIRRGKEYEACYWAYVMHQSGFGAYVWRRLSIICCEDIGNADPMASMLVSSLASSWERLHKHNKLPSLDKFLLVSQATLYMCRARKTRECDSLVNLIDENWKDGKRLEIPSVALDSHTDRGRQEFGRFGDMNDGKEKLRIEKWFSEWAYIENKAGEDKWQEELENIWLSRIKK